MLDCFRVPERCFCCMCTFYPIQDVNRWVSQVRFGGGKPSGSGYLSPARTDICSHERGQTSAGQAQVKPGRCVPSGLPWRFYSALTVKSEF